MDLAGNLSLNDFTAAKECPAKEGKEADDGWSKSLYRE